jgi:hypothetical protein
LTENGRPAPLISCCYGLYIEQYSIDRSANRDVAQYYSAHAVSGAQRKQADPQHLHAAVDDLII